MNCHASAPGNTLLDSTARGLPDLVRASVHYYNTEDEVARFAQAVAALAPNASPKALLATAPLEGIDLERAPDLGRDVDL
jgi:hypothetical protein